jgi:hypothetical protein
MSNPRHFRFRKSRPIPDRFPAKARARRRSLQVHRRDDVHRLQSV